MATVHVVTVHSPASVERTRACSARVADHSATPLPAPRGGFSVRGSTPRPPARPVASLSLQNSHYEEYHAPHSDSPRSVPHHRSTARRST